MNTAETIGCEKYPSVSLYCNGTFANQFFIVVSVLFSEFIDEILVQSRCYLWKLARDRNCLLWSIDVCLDSGISRVYYELRLLSQLYSSANWNISLLHCLTHQILTGISQKIFNLFPCSTEMQICAFINLW